MNTQDAAKNKHKVSEFITFLWKLENCYIRLKSLKPRNQIPRVHNIFSFLPARISVRSQKSTSYKKQGLRAETYLSFFFVVASTTQSPTQLKSVPFGRRSI